MIVTDRCPGVLRPHRAEDGLMVRLRIPGGRTDAATLRTLSTLAATYGNPALQLTTRAGLQLRGLPDPVPTPLVDALSELGLVPDAGLERVRNIVCSPLTGVSGGLADLRGLVHDLDAAIVARPALADLSGRFLFALDDGRGDVTGSPYDLAYRALSADDGLLLVGHDGGKPCPQRFAAVRLVELAEQFLALRPDRDVWHVRDLPDGRSLAPQVTPPSPGRPGTPLGAAGDAAVVQVPLGLLQSHQVDAVVANAEDTVIITPWRGLVLAGAAGRLDALAAVGLLTDERSPWTLISACVGAPHCERTTADTRGTAAAMIMAGEVNRRTHLSGCSRRCGAPAGDFADLVLDVGP